MASFSLKTTKTLWGRAASRCSICRIPLADSEIDTDDPTLIGEMCHIVAGSKDGPRGESTLDQVSRDKYQNLILLCRNHHKEIDDNRINYSVERLHEIKNAHEEWVRITLGFDEDKERIDSYYISIVENWENKCHIEDWENLTWSFMYGSRCNFEIKVYDDIMDFCRWIIKRHWPRVNLELENAFMNFKCIANDMLNYYARHMKTCDDIMYTYDKFYRSCEWNPERYDRLGEQYDYDVNLLHDFLCEMTRCGNLIISIVRRTLHRSYRDEEGKLAVISGDALGERIYVLEYSRDDLDRGVTYQGINRFKADRGRREFHFGKD